MIRRHRGAHAARVARFLLWGSLAWGFAAGSASERDATNPVKDLPLFLQVREFRKDGHFDLALSASRRMLAEMEADPRARDYELRNRREQVRVLEGIVGLPETDRAELARVERAVDEFRRAMREARFQDAAEIADDQRAVRERILGPQHHDVATSLHVLGLARRALGAYEVAEALFTRSLALYEDRLGPHAASVAMSRDALGGLHEATGDYERAVAQYRIAVTLYRTYHFENELHIASSMAGLARALMGLGRLGEAEVVFAEAIRVARHAAADSFDGPVTELANLLASREENERAEPLYREAIRRRSGSLGEHHPEVADLMHALADLLDRTERSHEALELRHRATRALHVTYEGAHVRLAESLRKTGDSHARLDRWAVADSLYATAVSMYTEAGTPAHPGAALAVRGLGDVARAAGDAASAGSHYEEALARLVASFGDHHAEVLRTHVRRSTLGWIEGEPERAIPPLLSARESFEGVRARIESPGQRVAFRDSPEPALAAAFLAARRQEEAWEALERYHGRSLEDVLRAAGSADVRAEPTTPATVQAHLPDDTALLGWLDVEVAPKLFVSWGWVLLPRGPVRWVALESGGAERELKKMLTLAGSWPLRLGEDERLSACAAAVARRRMDPLLPHLRGTSRWIVVPSDEMVAVPIEMLSGADGTFYGDRVAISYIPSATLAAARLRADRSDSERRGALVVGSPFADPIDDLPSSEEEVRRVAAMFDSAHVLIGAQATERAFVDLAASGRLADFSVIHVSAHAVVDAVRPERSALILTAESDDAVASALTGERIVDGRLTAWEIAREWRTDADLVTLSGCSTALGRPVEGEGYLGFAQVLLRTGARNLLLSLWNVDDEATARFMGRFYETLARGDAGMAEALQTTRAWLRTYRRADGSAPYVHPVYWAGFVLVGCADEPSRAIEPAAP